MWNGRDAETKTRNWGCILARIRKTRLQDWNTFCLSVVLTDREEGLPGAAGSGHFWELQDQYSLLGLRAQESERKDYLARQDRVASSSGCPNRALYILIYQSGPYESF